MFENIDFSDPVVIVGLIAMAVLGAIVLAGGKTRIQELLVEERKWFGEVANYESGMGLSVTMTAPYTALASGDLPGAVNAAIAKAKYIAAPANQATEMANVLQKQYQSNPAAKTAIDKFVSDLQAGASSSQLASDVSEVGKALPATPGFGPVASRVQSAAASIQSIANNPSLAGPLGVLHSLNLPSELEKGLTAFASAIHQIGQQTVAGAATGAAAGAAGGPAGAATGAAAGAAAGAVNAAVTTITAPSTHTINVTPPAQ